jgi:hypothetical protein
VTTPSADGFTSGPDVGSPAGGYFNAPVSAPDFTLKDPQSAPGFTETVPNLSGESPPALSGVVYVDITALNQAVAVASDAASEAVSDAKPVDSAVNRSGSAPWGDDPGLGQSFGSVFADPRTTLLQVMDALPELLGTVADVLQQASKAFAALDVEAP